MVSNSSLQKAASRIRSGAALPHDEMAITEYRNGLAPILIQACAITQDAIGRSSTACEFAARLKRYDSIVRKIIRQKTHPGRMDDIVGLRIIVRNRDDQAILVAALQQLAEVSSVCRDYVSDPVSTGYRAVHQFIELVDDEGRIVRVEIQVRTYAQHLWASLSESFGQQVKEGGGPCEIRSFLLSVSQALDRFDVTHDSLSMVPIGESSGGSDEFVVISFAVESRRLQQEIRWGSDIVSAVDTFSLIESQNTIGLETVLLYCRDVSSLRRTHIAYFPASLVAELSDVATLQLPDWVIARLLLPKETTDTFDGNVLAGIFK